MRLIVGLGNPGGDYVSTRHNVGFDVIDELRKHKLPAGLVATKTNTFMNDSGEFVGKELKKLNLETENLYVVHDDLDIKLGEYKIQLGRGPKDHNGLSSINKVLGTDQYWHVRIGIDNRPLDNRPMGEEYVLQNFNDKERVVLDKIIHEVCKKLVTL